MNTGLFILTVFFALFTVYGIDSAHALEFKPLITKNIDDLHVSTGIVGEPIIFEYFISNDESNFLNFEIFFTTFTVRDKHLDQQIFPVNLKPGETKTMTYQFVPVHEDNYITRVSSNDPFVRDTIVFSALKDGEDYPKKTVKIYSDSSDEDCLIACTEPSEMTIDIGTVVEWDNTTSGSRHFSTGSYKAHENGASWSADKRFQSTISPDKKSTYLFYQPGEYQFFLAEHRSSGQVIGTIHVLSDTFTEHDRTINILQEIMEDQDSVIPITSLYVNPKNSIITVGIDDRKNPLFTLDVYKTMLYKQVGNVFLNIVADNTPKVNPCDINDEVKVRNVLDNDPVVQAFLERHPSAEFIHTPTYDEPGNPWITDEFVHDGVSLRIIVSTHDPDGVCHWIRGYSIGNEMSSLIGTGIGMSRNQNFEVGQIQDAMVAIKDLTNVSKQMKIGVSSHEIKCRESLTLISKYDGSPACVKSESISKLIERGWTSMANMLSSKYSTLFEVEKLLTENQIEYVHDKLVVTTGPSIRGDPGCGVAVDVDSSIHWFGIDSISNPSHLTLFSENPNQCKVNTGSCFCNAQIELTALTLDKLDYFTLNEQKHYADILMDYLYDENINRTPKFQIGKINLNYTNASAIGYCGEIWGSNTYGFFSGAVVNDVVKDYGIDKQLPLLCAISDDAKWWENEN